ncbi:hypothetical protein D3C74_260240 [compost metagenome]
MTQRYAYLVSSIVFPIQTNCFRKRCMIIYKMKLSSQPGKNFTGLPLHNVSRGYGFHLTINYRQIELFWHFFLFLHCLLDLEYLSLDCAFIFYED